MEKMQGKEQFSIDAVLCRVNNNLVILYFVEEMTSAPLHLDTYRGT